MLKIRMSYRREILKLNKDNFQSWQELMRLNLETIEDSSLKYLDSEYKTPTRTLSMEDSYEKKNHNIMMIGISSSLNYAKFDEVKDCPTAFHM